MPIADRPILLLCAAAYGAAVVVLGLFAARRTRSSRDFFIAGQRLGPWLTALATMTAAFSGFVFLGGPGLTYRMGASSLFICISIGFTPALLIWVAGRPLRALAVDDTVFTVPDAILVRYRSRLASGLAALAVLAGSIGYLGAQILALGVVVEALLDTRARFGAAGPLVALAIGLGIVLFYTVLGGMVAGVLTDALQGLLMMVGASAIFVLAWRASGGWTGTVAAISADPAFGTQFLDPLGIPPATAFGFFFLFAIGTLGQPHMLHKFFMLRDPRRLRWMPLTLGACQSLSLLIWIGVGLAVPALVARGLLRAPADPDQATPLFLLHVTPDALAGLAFAALLAAIMSSANAFLSIAAAAVVRDLPRAFGRPPLVHELAWGRASTLIVGLVAAAVAWFYGDLIALLGTIAFGTFAAALAPVIAIGLHWPRVGAAAAAASIATGLGLNLGLELWGRSSLPPLLPAGALPGVVALAASFLVLLLWSLARAPDPTPGSG